MKKDMEEIRKKNGRRAEGFTFVETLAVLAIGAVLSAGTAVSANRLMGMARKVSCRNEIEQFYSALEAYFLDCGQFPSTDQGLGALWRLPELYPVPKDWNGPYVKKMPGKDPWGSDYKYANRKDSYIPVEVPEGIPFVIMSAGENGSFEEGEEADDIVSWK